MQQQKIVLYTLFACIFCTFSPITRAEQLPDNYYASIEGKKDSLLKVALHQIIRGGERLEYGTNTYHSGYSDPKLEGQLKAYGTWHGFRLADSLSNGCVWDMYSTTKRYFPIQGGSAAGMNIEHCLPKSWWGGIENDAYKDLYHLNPADQAANNNKSNYPPGFLNDSNKVNNGVFFMGKDNTWNDFAFSVVDEYKGDFARAYLYIATAYHDMQWDTNYSKYVTNQSYLTFTPHLIEVLLQWHRLDPVSEKEINRQNAISSIQKNRNPFIDYPELVEYIWGTKQGIAVCLDSITYTNTVTYKTPTDSINPMAYPATEVTPNSFIAHWKDQARASYTLEVFTLETTGHNDTLITMPGFNKDIVTASNGKIQWLKEDGTSAQYRQMDGTHATCLSSTTEKRQIRLTNFGKAPQHSYLTVKCCVYKGDQTADLLVRGNNNQLLYTQPLTLDEQFYTFEIPEGTTSISLIQKEIGSKSKGYHRISLQQAHLFHGDYQFKELHIDGSPFILNTTSYYITHTLPSDTPIHYRVTPLGLRTSNTITIYPNSFTNTYNTLINSCKTTKIIQNGQLYIIQNNHKYDTLGHKYAR